MQLREETEIIQHSTILVRNVTSTPSFRDMPVVVTAYSKEKNKRTIVHYTTLHEPGSYELIVPNYNLTILSTKMGKIRKRLFQTHTSQA